MRINLLIENNKFLNPIIQEDFKNGVDRYPKKILESINLNELIMNAKFFGFTDYNLNNLEIIFEK